MGDFSVLDTLNKKGQEIFELASEIYLAITEPCEWPDAKAAEVRDAFIFQVTKNIGSMACVLKGQVDQIIVTGGIAYDKGVVAGLKEAAEWIAPFTVYPGEDELLALVQGGLRVMNGEEEAKVY